MLYVITISVCCDDSFNLLPFMAAKVKSSAHELINSYQARFVTLGWCYWKQSLETFQYIKRDFYQDVYTILNEI